LNVIQALPYVMLLIAMLFFIYAIIGMQVFNITLLPFWIVIYLYIYSKHKQKTNVNLVPASFRTQTATDQPLDGIASIKLSAVIT